MVEARSGLKQAWPHVPQKSGSVWRSTQFPGFVPQVVGVASGQRHVDPLQLPPFGHRAPQAPQLRSLDVRSTHDPQQVCVPVQVTPQFPQFAGSWLASTHLPPHSMLGKKHFSFFGEHPARSRTAATGARRASARFTVRMIRLRSAGVHLRGRTPRVRPHAAR